MLGHITDPSAPQGLVRREVPEPEPGDHDVVIGVAAYAVNRGELALLANRSDGWTPGQDVAGVVVRAAADGTGPAEGARVVGGADQGGWSERVAVPSHRVAQIPDDVSFAQAASLPVAGLTALRALRVGGSLLGRSVLVTGASGGVGSFAVQLAAAAGARVTALVSGPHRVAEVEGLGAAQSVTVLDEHTGPFDVAIDGVGGPVLTDVIHRMAPGGTVVAYGVAGGEPKSSLAFSDFASAPLTKLVGFFIYATEEETFGDDLGVLAGLISTGRLDPKLAVVRDWADTVEAVDALRQRKAAGKVVLTL